MALYRGAARAGSTGLSRRGFLAASGAGLVALTVGCTASSEEPREPVTAAQADGFSDQVVVQALLVAAYAAAGDADPALAAEVGELAEQAGAQLDRLRAAAPDTGPPTTSPDADTIGPDPRAWLRTQVAATADSHTAACLEQSGARAALLGSLAAGLRGHEAVLA